MFDSLDESLCRSSPSGRVEAVPTDQAEIVQKNSLGCRSTATLIDYRPPCERWARLKPLRAVAARLQDLYSIRWTNHFALHPHPVKLRLCRRTGPGSCELTNSSCRSTATLIELPPPVRTMSKTLKRLASHRQWTTVLILPLLGLLDERILRRMPLRDGAVSLPTYQAEIERSNQHTFAKVCHADRTAATHRDEGEAKPAPPCPLSSRNAKLKHVEQQIYTTPLSH